jgi:peptidoglycan/LPS O-acetylase OafA/YrhL
MSEAAVNLAKIELTCARPRPGVGGRIPALDGLRGIAILLVLSWHLVFERHENSGFLPGLFALGGFTWSGVDLFFVLSGFLIGGILLDAKNSARYFKTFYVRRAFRILPLYGLITVVYVFYHLLLAPEPSKIPLISYPTFTQNFWMAYLGTFGTAGMGVTWSLAIEEQFYLTIPVLVRRLTRTRLCWALALVVIGAPVLRTLILLKFERGRFADYVLMPCRADALCLGVLAALLVRIRRVWNLLLAKRIWLRSASAGLLVILGWLALHNYRESATPMVIYGYSLLALFYMCCLLMALTETGVFHRALCNRQLMELGGIAYCVYLVHAPLIVEGRKLVPRYFPVVSRLPIPHARAVEELVAGLLGIIVTLAVAKFSWRFIEQPLVRRGHSYRY